MIYYLYQSVKTTKVQSSWEKIQSWKVAQNISISDGTASMIMLKKALFYIEGTKNPVDMFTKNLSQEALNNCWQQLGLMLYNKPQL